MKQLRELVNIHLRTGTDSHSTHQIKRFTDLVQRDSRSSVHDAFLEARSAQSRLKACQSQMLKTFITINHHQSAVKVGNNVEYAIAGFFLNDFSISWNVILYTAEEPQKVLIQEFVESQDLHFIGKDVCLFHSHCSWEVIGIHFLRILFFLSLKMDTIK